MEEPKSKKQKVENNKPKLNDRKTEFIDGIETKYIFN